jgi:hypothetical protein
VICPGTKLDAALTPPLPFQGSPAHEQPDQPGSPARTKASAPFDAQSVCSTPPEQHFARVARVYFTPIRSMIFRTNANNPAPRSTVTGSVRTHASSRFRSVSICNPEWLAAMVPATPEEST